MSHKTSTYLHRQHQAELDWSQLPHGGHSQITLRIHCAHNHDVAVVYDTPAGFIYSAPIRPRSHGSYDKPDTPHGNEKPHRYFDFLVVEGADDSVPAWCDCGSRELSRDVIRRWIEAGEHRVVID